MGGAYGSSALHMNEMGLGPLVVVIAFVITAAIFWFIDRNGRR